MNTTEKLQQKADEALQHLSEVFSRAQKLDQESDLNRLVGMLNERALQQQLNVVEAKVQNQRQGLNTVKDASLAVQSEMATLQQQLDQKHTDITGIQQQRKGCMWMLFQSRRNALDQQQQLIEEYISKIEQSQIHKHSQLTQLNQQISQAQQQVETAKVALKRLKEQVADKISLSKKQKLKELHNQIRQRRQILRKIVDRLNQSIHKEWGVYWFSKPSSQMLSSYVAPQEEALPDLTLGEFIKDYDGVQIVYPAVLPVFSLGNHLLLGGSGSKDLMFRTIWSIGMHLPHRVRFTFIDPKGLGAAFPMRTLVPIRETNNASIQKPGDIVKELNEDVGRFISSYIQGDVQTFDQLPAEVKLDEKLEVICIANYPEGWSEYDLEDLRLLCENGPTAGKFVVFQSSTSVSDKWLNLSKLTRVNCASLPVLKKTGFKFTPSQPLESSILTEGLRRSAAQKKPSTAIQLPIRSMSDMWNENVKGSLRACIGRESLREPLEFWFGTQNNLPCAHGALVGMTGSGKSNVYHTFICDLIQRYPPEELQLFLIDGKQGMTFQDYQNVPHAKIIVLQSVNEVSANVISILTEELKHRSSLFKTKTGKPSYDDYRAAGFSMPRIVLMIDEYHELFSQDDDGRISEQFYELAAQGRAFGIHFFIGGHNFGATGMKFQSKIFGNVHLRVALKLSEADRNSLIDKFGYNGAVLSKKCEQPGQVILNDSAGAADATVLGRVFWSGSDSRKRVVQQVLKMAQHRQVKNRPYCFDGMRSPSFVENRQLLRLIEHKQTNSKLSAWATLAETSLQADGLGLDYWPSDMAPTVLWLGKSFDVFSYATLILAREQISNVLLLGEGTPQRIGMIVSTLLSIPFSSHNDFQVYLLNRAGKLGQVCSHVANFFTEQDFAMEYSENSGDLEKICMELHNLLDERKTMSDAEVMRQTSCFLFVVETQNFRSLMPPVSSGYGMELSDAGNALMRLIQEGSIYGIHVVMSIATLHSWNSMLGASSLSFFKHKVLQAMDQSSSYDLIASNAANELNQSDYPSPALLHERTTGRSMKFKPYEYDIHTFQKERSKLNTMIGK